MCSIICKESKNVYCFILGKERGLKHGECTTMKNAYKIVQIGFHKIKEPQNENKWYIEEFVHVDDENHTNE